MKTETSANFWANVRSEEDGVVYYKFSEQALEQFISLIKETTTAEVTEDMVSHKMSNQAFSKAMDDYYERKWAHRFD